VMLVSAGQRILKGKRRIPETIVDFGVVVGQ
jgi:hypothetical protein